MINPITLELSSVKIVSGQKLREGSVVRAKVLRTLSSQRFELSVKGKPAFSVRSSAPLKIGQVLHFRVFKSGADLRLQIINKKNMNPPIAPEIRIFQPGILESALLRSGIGLPKESELSRMLALFRRTKGSKFRIARLYAEMISKGIDPGSNFLEKLDVLLSGNSRRDESGARSEWFFPPNQRELADELLNQKKLENFSLLDLLNSITDRFGNWKFVKTAHRLNDRDISLVWKIRGSTPPGMALSVHDGERTLEFLLQGQTSIRLSVYSDKNTVIDVQEWQNFRKRLRDLNVFVDKEILDIHESDGFSVQMTTDKESRI